MEYIFGERSDGSECVKVVSENGTDMSGSYTIERHFSDQIITDSFRVTEKYRTAEDDGKVYDWYSIINHTRYTDKFTPGIAVVEQEITDYDLALLEAEQEITELDIRIMELENKEV